MSARISSAEVGDPAAVSGYTGLRRSAIVAVITIGIIMAGYYQTGWSMVSIWERSDTFAHGFLVLPFSAYMIWTQRHVLSALPSQPNWRVLPLLAILGLGWLMAVLAGVQVVEQYMFVMIIPIAVWAILGNSMTGAISFPLIYLLLAVPFGDILIPFMIDFTADFTVSALQLTGIPVYREGNFFMIPSGNWSVVEACSGLRYLIASFTLGTLYAYLTYRSLKRRAGFILLSLAVPIVANWVRAYLIVMTGHLSGNRLAVGVDHLIYGWIFFGIVMLLLFWAGSYWQENGQDQGAGNQPASDINPSVQPSTVSLQFLLTVAGAVLALTLVWPAYAAYLRGESARPSLQELKIDDTGKEWKINSQMTVQGPAWKPVYIAPSAQLLQSYQNGARSAELYITYYQNQQQGAELVNSGNILAAEDSPWRNLKEEKRNVLIGSDVLHVNQGQLSSASARLLVWRWYQIGEEETASPYMAKFILARNKLMSNEDSGAEIMIAVPYDEDPEEAVLVMESFLKERMLSIRQVLQYAEHQ